MNEATKHDAGKPDLTLIPETLLLSYSEAYCDTAPVMGLCRYQRPAQAFLSRAWYSFVCNCEEAGYSDILADTARVLTAAIPVYGLDNWRKGMAWSRPLAAFRRHVVLGQRYAISDGLKLDPQFNLPHLAHASAALMFLSSYAREGLGTNDLWTHLVDDNAAKP